MTLPHYNCRIEHVSSRNYDRYNYFLIFVLQIREIYLQVISELENDALSLGWII